MPHLNGSQHWFSRNSARVISHLENPATVEGISWGDLWCEWKHGHTGGPGAPWLQQPSILAQLSPPQHHNPINAPLKALNAVFWFQKISNKKMYSLQRISHKSSFTILQSRIDAQPAIFGFNFMLVHLHLSFMIIKMEIMKAASSCEEAHTCLHPHLPMSPFPFDLWP